MTTAISFRRKMKIKSILLTFTVLLPLILISSSIEASDLESCQTYTTEIITCKPYTVKELNSIKTSNKPGLIAGAGIVELVISSTSTVGRELLVLGSQMESPKGMATAVLIMNQLNNYLSLTSVRDDIAQLLQDDKENALPYYANALLLMEDGKGQESIAQINRGNAKQFNGYSKQRFHEIVEAGIKADCSKVQIQRHALGQALNTGLIIKSRKLCEKLTEANGPEAKKACLAMGNNLERSSITIVDRLNSLGIQRIALKGSPDSTTALNEIKNGREKAVTCDGKKPDMWIPFSDVNEETDLKYDEIYLDSGECSALEFLSAFIKQKKQKN
jgi:hypothetical protein